ncbi:MAG: DUF294 nucleotidyltransferase-like domain-containing protein [Armatimonadota bacterium]
MNATTRVDFHCHSSYSDGTLAPGALVAQLAADQVAFASLTDHDSVDGLAGFRQEASRRGVGFISGVEITVRCDGTEAHLLGYGFDPGHPELQAALQPLRRARAADMRSVAAPVHGRSSRLRREERAAQLPASAPNGWIEIAHAIALIHRAGGKAFLAHPFTVRADAAGVRALLADLSAQGLDGVEALYGPYGPEQQQALVEMADELGLLVSGGSDAHERGGTHGRLGIDMPTVRWKQFRDAVCCGAGGQSGIAPVALSHPRHRFKRRRFLFHVVFPTLLSIALFAVALWAVFLPTYERSLMDRKREMIRQLTETAWSILAGYEREVQAGVLTRARAQRLAAAQIERLRYGPEGKDYFWLQDMHPRMIMHPYRRDLNGRDVSDFRDPRGVRIFVEFADLVRRRQEGYVGYVWQWKDDPRRLAPKQSYIKGFEPWGWIIGTGLYVEDVRQEIARVERGLVLTLLGISALVALLLLYVLRQSLNLEQRRADAEESLRESTERYRSLVEATTEGTLLVVDRRCRYANPTLLGMLGASEQELELLDLEDVLPRGQQNAAAWEAIERLGAGQEPSGGFEGVLRRRDGGLTECVLTLSGITFAGRSGLIVLVKPIGLGGGDLAAAAGTPDARLGGLDAISGELPAGLFRARATPRGTVVMASASAARLLRQPGALPGSPLALAELFQSASAYQDFLAEAQREGEVQRRLHLATEEPGTRSLALSAVLVRDDAGRPRFLDGVIEDVTQQERHEAEREAMIERLQSSMLFLHEPVSHVRRSAVFCALDTPVASVAASMTASRATAALVRSEAGEAIGIFTDRDLRERVIAAGADLSTPISRVMSAPLIVVPEDAVIYEALLAMEEREVQHLAVADDSGHIVGVIRHRDLLAFPSYGPLVLAREVSAAASAAEAIASCRRAPGLAKALLSSGARPQQVTRMLTSVCDAATRRFVELAQDRLGPAPAPFAFLGLGSHGREELVLSSDQDNALVYADEAAGDEAVAAYFVELGRLVCGWLDEAGYPYCRGDVMAQNPRWCRPLSTWEGYFSEWITHAEPENLREFSIFFDFRAIAGATDFATRMRDHVSALAADHPPFFLQLAQEVLVFRPPLRLFGRILVGGTGGEPSGMLDLKAALRPIVGFARLYSLRQGLCPTNTLDRLAALAAAEVLSEASREETQAAWDSLMRLRLQHQSEDLEAGQPPDNLINYRLVGQIEQALLNQAFAQIVAIQRRVSHDFLGGVEQV